MLIISLAGVIYTSPQLTLMIVLLVPAVVIPVIWIARKVRKFSRTAQDKVADSSGLANETLNAIETIQAFTLEPLQSKRFGDAVEAAFSAALTRIRVRFVMSFGGMFLLFGAITGVLWIGVHEVMDGSMQAGELAQFVIFTVLLASSGAMPLQLSTRSFTAATELSNILFSEASNSISTTFSQPFAPIIIGTPTYISFTPYSPER